MVTTQQFIDNYLDRDKKDDKRLFFKLYMGDVSDFVNFFLRYEKLPPQTFEGGLRCSFDVKGIPAFIQLFEKIITNEDTFEEEVCLYRGIPVSIDNDIEIHVGKNFSDKGFMSTSKNINIAKRFMCMDANTMKPPEKYNRILFKINSHRSGIDFSKYATDDYTKEEEEVVFKPNTQFLIKSNVKDTISFTDELEISYIMYELEEV